MAKDNTTLLLLGVGGVAAWYGYQQGWFASFGFAPAVAAAAAGSSSSSSSSSGSSAPAGGSSSSSSSAPAGGSSGSSAGSGASAPSYSGPSLAAMLTALTARVKADLASFTCPQSASSDVSAAAANLQTAQNALALATTRGDIAGIASAQAQVISAAQALAALAAAQGSGSTACDLSTATKTCDNFNWYLVNANIGVTDGMLNCSDHSTPMTLAQYWAWAAPQLQTKIPGLSGLGNVYAGLGALVRMRKRGW